MFNELKRKIQQRFADLSKEATHCFTVDPDREKIYQLYLDGFTDPAIKQEHTCNCCKSFLRQYGGIVFIVNNEIKNLWSIQDVPEDYVQAVRNINDYLETLPVKDVFFNAFSNAGTNFNTVQLDNGGTIRWEHFYLTLPKQFIHKPTTVSIESKQGEVRSNKEVLKRSLDELSIEATETILELIGQNSIYRGAEFVNILRAFLEMQQYYRLLTSYERDNYCWSKAVDPRNGALCKIRNSAIGTLLIDLSNGVPLDDAVSAFERVVAPSNYKRPTALVTPRMIEQAKEKIKELGYFSSLDRRFAKPTDLSVNNLLFVYNKIQQEDIFSDLKAGVTITADSLNRIEEVKMTDFIANVLPKAKSLKILFENRHLNNLVTLTTAVDPTSPTMFKWDNQFSRSYTGGFADSMKQMVKDAGGNVDGILRFSIRWNESGQYKSCDLDAHAKEPDGTYIKFNAGYRKDSGDKRTSMSGQLDVDMINPSKNGIENITWIDQNKMKEGTYSFYINNYNSGSNDGVRIQIAFLDQSFDLNYAKNLQGTIHIADVIYSRTKGFTLVSKLDTTSSKPVDNTKWNLTTNKFIQVNSIMLSPNYWQQQIGNKHFIFALEGCICDEDIRSLYNEDLNQVLNENRKVLEVLGSKLKLPKSDIQVSGLGFSETQPNTLIVQVEGNFKRTVKINF